MRPSRKPLVVHYSSCESISSEIVARRDERHGEKFVRGYAIRSRDKNCEKSRLSLYKSLYKEKYFSADKSGPSKSRLPLRRLCYVVRRSPTESGRVTMTE